MSRESNVLVIYTGGTIGMVKQSDGVLKNMPDQFEKELRKYPNLHDPEYKQSGSLSLPEMDDLGRVLYRVLEKKPLLSSANITPDDWVQIVKDIQDNYQSYDGFVILIGTDTLCYTAAALSFMLEDVGKTVVVTGAQIPIFQARSDGRDNFISALILAGNYLIPEVVILCSNQVYRGNRAIKVSTSDFNAFASPNSSPIAEFGVDIKVNNRNIFRRPAAKFNPQTKLSDDVNLLRIFPNISASIVKAALQSPVAGVVLQTFGAGTFPIIRNDILSEIEDAVQRGVIIVNCTQCQKGSVNTIYEESKVLNNLGVISGYDMTPEAALTKLAFVLGKTEDAAQRKSLMQQNLRGEFTSTENDDHLSVNRGPKATPAAIPTTQPQTVASEAAPTAGTGTVAGSAGTTAKTGSVTQATRSATAASTAVPTAPPTSATTAVPTAISSVVPTAASTGAPTAASYTMPSAGTVPGMISATSYTNANPEIYPALLNTAVMARDLNRVMSLKDKGVDMNCLDYDKRSALHIAAAEGCLDIVKYLLSIGVPVHARDRHDRTPLLEAIYTDNLEMIKVFMDAGAHISGAPTGLGKKLCVAAARCSVKRLKSYELAGANLSQADLSGRTALHEAVLHKCEEVINYLLSKNVNKDAKDELGLTPLDIAKMTSQDDVVAMLS